MPVLFLNRRASNPIVSHYYSSKSKNYMTSNSSSLKLIETEQVQKIKHYCMCMSFSKIGASNPTVSHNSSSKSKKQWTSLNIKHCLPSLPNKRKRTKRVILLLALYVINNQKQKLASDCMLRERRKIHGY